MPLKSLPIMKIIQVLTTCVLKLHKLQKYRGENVVSWSPSACPLAATCTGSNIVTRMAIISQLQITLKGGPHRLAFATIKNDRTRSQSNWLLKCLPFTVAEEEEEEEEETGAVMRTIITTCFMGPDR